MNPELDRLEQHVGRLLAAARRLAEENRTLRQQLGDAQRRHDTLRQRMGEAREQVRNALSRLPGTAGQDS